MTFVLSMQLTADAKVAKSEIASTAAEAKKLSAATTDAGGKARAAGAGVTALGGASAGTTAQITALSTAEKTLAATALQVNQSHRIAGGGVANLTAQFNDIGVMLAAGQNPLQMALQQGTQITQVIGPMGAAGAVKALGSAFVGMLNPVSLVTIGSIAAGAAMIQWLTGAGEEVINLEDRLDSLENSVSSFDSAMSAASATADSLFDGYGNFANTAQKVLAVQAEIARLDSLRALNSAVGDISTTFGQFDRVVADSGDTLRDNYMDTVNRLANDFDITRFQAAALADALNAVGTAEGPEAQAIALSAAREQIEMASGGLAEMSGEARDVYDGLLAAELAAAKLAGIDMASGVAAAANEATRLADYFGISLVTAARLARLGPQGVPNQDAYVGPNGKVEVGRGGAVDPRTMGGTAEDYMYREADSFLENWRPPRVGRSGSGRGKGGTSEIEKQRKALDDLIEREERELALLRETDPIKKEMLRNREAMAGATDAERAKVEELIGTRMREKEAMESLQWVGAQAGDTLIDALMGSKDAGEQLIQTLKRAALEALFLGKGPLAGLFGGGGGLLGAVFGGAADAALPTTPFSGVYADGGMIHGPGGSRDDRVPVMASRGPVWGSNGEFMMNAKATARYRHLLEAMNSNSPIPGFADGGAIGGGPVAGFGGFGSGGDSLSVAIDLRGAQGDKTIEEKAFAGMQAALSEWERKQLPRKMASARRDPRRIG